MRNQRNAINHCKKKHPTKVNYQTRKNDYVQPKETGEVKSSPASNDVSWYANNPELLRSAASLPYSRTMGQKLPFVATTSVPGIMSLYWVPITGAGPALNQAANMTYFNTVHANSRNTSYTAADEMLVILAGANVFAALAHGIRAYGIMKYYEQQNSYTPRDIVEAMGFDYDDLVANLPTMWFSLNELIARSSQIWIPDEFPLITRWFWMNSNIYKDTDSVKGQYYIYVQDAFYVYSETTSEQGGQLLKDTVWGDTSVNIKAGKLKKWSDYLALMNRMLNALINSEDRGIIFGDILKAYGKERLYGISAIDASYAVVPVYDMEVLTQIENAYAYPANFKGIESLASTNSLQKIWDVTRSWTVSNLMSFNQVLNFPQKEVPTPEQNMVATRLKFGHAAIITSGTSSVNPVVELHNMGSEFITQFCITSHYYSSNDVDPVVSRTFFSSVVDNIREVLPLWCAFDHAPWLYEPTGTAPAKTVGTSLMMIPSNVYGDWEMYSILTEELIARMNTTAIYGELGVPTIL